jgi:glycine cleavage system regulatory protein
MRTIFIAGNTLVDEDSMPLKLMPLLQKEFPQIDFIEFDPTENFPEQNEEFCLIDTIKGISKPRIFTDIDEFINKKRVSLHDFDIAWEMKLMKKTGKLKEILIIGVPMEMDIYKIFNEIKALISGKV